MGAFMKKYMLCLAVLMIGFLSISSNVICGYPSQEQKKRWAQVLQREAERAKNNGIDSRDGSTTWHEMAELCGSGSTIRISYVPGTDPRLPNNAGETPIEIARERLERFAPGTAQYIDCEIIRNLIAAAIRDNDEKKNQ